MVGELQDGDGGVVHHRWRLEVESPHFDGVTGSITEDTPGRPHRGVHPAPASPGAVQSPMC